MKRDEPNKFYVFDEVNITFICPKCGYTKFVDVSKLKKGKINIKCKCAAIIQCSIEFRKSYRKNVRLSGQYRRVTNEVQYPVTITDISASGVRLTCHQQPSIKAGEMLELNFRLDDNKESEIRLTAHVIWVRERDVGLKIRESHGFQKTLGFYLMK